MRNLLAKSPYEILWTLADPLGKVHLLYPVKNHGVDPDWIRACEWRADSRVGHVIFQTPSIYLKIKPYSSQYINMYISLGESEVELLKHTIIMSQECIRQTCIRMVIYAVIEHS